MLVLLAVTFGEGGSASNGEPRRKGTINHYFVSLCVFIPYRQNLAYAPFCHFQPLLSLCDISSASTEEFTPEGGSRRTIYNLPTGKYNFAKQNITATAISLCIAKSNCRRKHRSCFYGTPWASSPTASLKKPPLAFAVSNITLRSKIYIRRCRFY